MSLVILIPLFVVILGGWLWVLLAVCILKFAYGLVVILCFGIYGLFRYNNKSEFRSFFNDKVEKYLSI